MYPGGYYKRWRKELDSEIWEMDPLYIKVWDWILASVDYETGTLTTTLRLLALDVGWKRRGCPHTPSKQTLIDILEWMEAKAMIERRTDGEGNAKYTKVTVLNWHTYQSCEISEGTQETPRRERSGYPLEEVQEPKEPPHPAPAPPREEGLGVELGVATKPAPLTFRFSRMPTSEQRAEVKRAGFAYDGHGNWSAPWSAERQAVVDRLRPYLATNAPTVPPAAVPAPATPPARPLATGAATGAQGATPEPPPALPPTPAHLQPVLARIRGELAPRSWATWFEHLTLAGDAERLEVVADNPIVRDFVQGNYREALERACRASLGRVPAAIEFLVAGHARASPPGGPPPAPATEPAAEAAAP